MVVEIRAVRTALFLVFLLALLQPCLAAELPRIIAHRGASGYLPEHTLEAHALAHGQNADFIELDIILTKDSKLIVFHDLTLDATTNVHLVYPHRHRADGHWYAMDFTLGELRKLKVGERRTAEGKAVFPGRFPPEVYLYRIATLEEVIAQLRGLNKSSGKKIGLDVEIKDPQFHLQQGMNLSRLVHESLMDDPAILGELPLLVQSFDARCLKYLAHTLQAPYPLVQLLDHVPCPEAGITAITPKDFFLEVSAYAQGIALDHQGLGTSAYFPHFVHQAKKQGLTVDIYTARQDKFPDCYTSFSGMISYLHEVLAVDGIITDFPDSVRAILNRE